MIVREQYSAEQQEQVDSRIRATCHPKQELFVFDPSMYVSLLTGRGGGKTTGALLRLIRRMVSQPDANCLFIAATRVAAERLVWRDLKRILHALRIKAHLSEQKLSCELKNGARLSLVGCDDKRDIGKLRGLTYHEIVVDEVASINAELLRELIDEIIGPRLVGALCLIGTPGKVLEGRFYEATRPGSERHRPYTDRDLPEYAGWIDWSSHAWTVIDGAAHGIKEMQMFLQKAEVRKRQEGWTDQNPLWQREYLGRWIADSSQAVYIYKPHDEAGREFNEWDPFQGRTLAGEEALRAAVAALPSHIDDWGFGIGMDVGWSDAFAIEVFAFSYSDPSRTLWHVHEIYKKRQYANSIAKMLIGESLDHDSYGGVIGVIGWPVAMVGDFARSGHGLLAELGEIYGINVVAADKNYAEKANSVELLNSMLIEGQVRLIKGSNIAREMLTLQWVVDQWGKRTENKGQDNHGCDSLLYLRNALASMLPSAGVVPVREPRRANPADDLPKRYVEPQQDADSLYTAEEWL